MDTIRIKPTPLAGKVCIPSSKSMGHREIICAALAEGTSVVDNISMSADIEATCRALEALGRQITKVPSKYPDRIIFTGAIPREELGVVYAALDVFAFPSLKDTQGWVLHEAAHARLPIVLIDRGVSEIVEDGKNGYFANNNPTDMARKIIALLRSPTKRARFGEHSKELARKFTEKHQTRKLEKLYQEVIVQHDTRGATQEDELPKLVDRLRARLKKY